MLPFYFSSVGSATGSAPVEEDRGQRHTITESTLDDSWEDISEEDSITKLLHRSKLTPSKNKMTPQKRALLKSPTVSPSVATPSPGKKR